MAELKPRFLMVNYQDPDHVHWGNPGHYTRAIRVIDEGLQRLVAAADADPFYRDNTIFVITPDCGRDANLLAEVPFQHHFNARSAHEVWAVIFSPGIGKGGIDKPVDPSATAPTIAAAMGFAAHRAKGDVMGPSCDPRNQSCHSAFPGQKPRVPPRLRPRSAGASGAVFGPCLVALAVSFGLDLALGRMMPPVRVKAR